MPQAVTIRSLPRAFEFVKAMQAQGLDWGEGYRGLAGRQLRPSCRARWRGRSMSISIGWPRSTRPIDAMAAIGHLLTELGDIELAVPRTRRFAPIAVVRAYARRPEQVDRMILSCFVLGLSVRKVSEALRRSSDGRSALATVSLVAKQLDVQHQSHFPLSAIGAMY